MKEKIYSFVGLIAGFGGLYLSAQARTVEGNLSVYLLIGSLVVILVCVLELGILFSRKRRRETPQDKEQEKELPYYKRKGSIMTRVEMDLYYLLKDMFSDKYEILPQVALNSIIDKLTQNSYRSELFRIADFCLVDKDTFAPLLLIELNDSSHQRADRIERDRKVSVICERAGLPLVTFSMQDVKNSPQVRKTIIRNVLRK